MIALSPVNAYAAPPSNDDFVNRTSVSAQPFTDSRDTSEATEEDGEPFPRCAPIGKTVWYEYTPAADAVVQADALGSDFDTVIAVWTGDGLGDLVDIGCDDDTGFGSESMVVFSASAGTTYLIQVGGFAGDSGSLSLRVGPPTSGSISGTVTSDTGEPLPNVCIDVRAAAGGFGGWTRTTGAGRYTVGGLDDGVYRVRFYDGCDNQRDHRAEWFDDQPTEETATNVVVTSPEALTGIDAELTSLVLGSISGTVTSETGAPLPNICIEIYDPATGEYFGWAPTNSTGAYTLDAPEGTYHVAFHDSCDDRRDHRSEWFDDQLTEETAAGVVVTGNTTTSGIDAELTELGSITGTVTSDTGEPLPDVCVDVYDTVTDDFAGWADTTSSGTFTAAVPAGAYYVQFYDCYGPREHQEEWFDDQPTLETATEVVVIGSGTTSGIDAELTSLAIGTISGTVTSDAGEPLNNICIEVMDSATGYFAGWADTTSSGSYTVLLPAGSYHVGFFDWCDARNDHRAEWFDDQPTLEAAHEVVVADDTTTPGIDAELTSLPATPQTTITAGPSGITTSPAASFVFTASEPGSTFECSLDEAAFSPCTSPTSFSDLIEGSHRFRARATGPDGDIDPSPAERHWVVDSNPPVLSIHRPTGGPYVNDESAGGTGPIVVVGSVRVEATAIDAQSGVSSFRFEVDGIPVDPTAVTREGPTYRFTYRPATPGQHTIGVRATNGSGLQSSMTISVIGVPAG